MIRYEFREPKGETAEQLMALSHRWVEEDCSYGMVANDESDLTEPLVVALDGDRIVGYCFGHAYTQERKTSCIETGAACFSVDEFYVVPEYRSRGIGKELFRMIEEKIRTRCSHLTLTTSTKNYRSILKLYVEELGMTFHSAFLFKNLEDTT